MYLLTGIKNTDQADDDRTEPSFRFHERSSRGENVFLAVQDKWIYLGKLDNELEKERNRKFGIRNYVLLNILESNIFMDFTRRLIRLLLLILSGIISILSTGILNWCP